MKAILNHLYEYKTLSKEQAKNILIDITEDKYNPAQVASFISVYIMRPIHLEELEGFREALLELKKEVHLDASNAIDLCGTGGDGKDTFNISTISSFVVAGAGYKVIKHGNYGVSSICGSSNVLENLGYQFTTDESRLNQQLEDANICFLHAPLFHSAMKSVAPIRKQLGVKTFFNLLGPLVNPVQPKYQSVGVFNLKVARLYEQILSKINREYQIVHSLDGYDECSLTGDCKLISKKHSKTLHPNKINMPLLKQEELFGGKTIEDAATIFKNVLNNTSTPAQKQAVLVNSALAIQCFDFNKPFEDCIAEAKESIESGKAFTSLKKLTL